MDNDNNEIEKPIMWVLTNCLRWKKIPVKQLTSAINAPRVDRVLQQKWVSSNEEDWRDVPEV